MLHILNDHCFDQSSLEEFWQFLHSNLRVLRLFLILMRLAGLINNLMRWLGPPWIPIQNLQIMIVLQLEAVGLFYQFGSYSRCCKPRYSCEPPCSSWHQGESPGLLVAAGMDLPGVCFSWDCADEPRDCAPQHIGSASTEWTWDWSLWDSGGHRQMPLPVVDRWRLVGAGLPLVLGLHHLPRAI